MTVNQEELIKFLKTWRKLMMTATQGELGH